MCHQQQNTLSKSEKGCYHCEHSTDSTTLQKQINKQVISFKWYLLKYSNPWEGFPQISKQFSVGIFFKGNYPLSVALHQNEEIVSNSREVDQLHM